MNTVLKAGAAGALTLAALGAHASVAAPSSGSSDAVLFAEVVSGSTVVSSYAADTGISINTITSGTKQTILGSDAKLQSLFAADAPGDTIVWALMGAQYTGSFNNAGTPGNATFITTSLGDSDPATSDGVQNSLLPGFATGFNKDVGTLNSNLKGANSVIGANPATAGVWDEVQNGGNTASWYGALPTANTIGSSQALFQVLAASGGNNALVASSQIGSTELVQNGATGDLVINTGGSPPPVPLPAAVWLLGSGLLGLTGVARRKLKA